MSYQPLAGADTDVVDDQLDRAVGQQLVGKRPDVGAGEIAVVAA